MSVVPTPFQASVRGPQFKSVPNVLVVSAHRAGACAERPKGIPLSIMPLVDMLDSSKFEVDGKPAVLASLKRVSGLRGPILTSTIIAMPGYMKGLQELMPFDDFQKFGDRDAKPRLLVRVPPAMVNENGMMAVHAPHFIFDRLSDGTMVCVPDEREAKFLPTLLSTSKVPPGFTYSGIPDPIFGIPFPNQDGYVPLPDLGLGNQSGARSIMLPVVALFTGATGPLMVNQNGTIMLLSEFYGTPYLNHSFPEAGLRVIFDVSGQGTGFDAHVRLTFQTQ